MTVKESVARWAGHVKWAGRGAGRHESRVLMLIGTVGIVAVLAGLLLAVALPHGWYLFRTDPYTAEFANAAGLEPGDPVLVAGVPTGKVESVEFAGDHVDVQFRLDDDRPLGAQTTAGVKLATILGKRYMEVDPAGTGDVGPDGTIPLSRTTVPYSLDESASAASDVARNVDVDAVEKMVETIKETLPQDSDTLRRAVTGVSAVAEAMNEDSEQINRLLDAGKALTGLLAEQDQTLDSVSADARTLLQTLASRRHAISRLITDLRTILTAADEVTAQADQGGSDGSDGLERLVDNLHSVLGTLQQNGGRIDEIFLRLPPVVRAVVDASGNGSWVDVSAPAGPIPDTLLCVFGVMKGCR